MNEDIPPKTNDLEDEEFDTDADLLGVYYEDDKVHLSFAKIFIDKGEKYARLLGTIKTSRETFMKFLKIVDEFATKIGEHDESRLEGLSSGWVPSDRTIH